MLDASLAQPAARHAAGRC